MKRNRLQLYGFILFMVWGVQSFAQTRAQADSAIRSFFVKMSTKDTAALRVFFMGNPELQTGYLKKDGETGFMRESLSEFLTSVAGIPDSIEFEERLTSVQVNLDLPLASAWCSYSFYVNGKLSHTGTDIFTLIYIQGYWKILQLADTRKKSGN